MRAWVVHNTRRRQKSIPDSKVHGANMGPIWGRQDPGGPHDGNINFAIWDVSVSQKGWSGIYTLFFICITSFPLLNASPDR